MSSKFCSKFDKMEDARTVVTISEQLDESEMSEFRVFSKEHRSDVDQMLNTPKGILRSSLSSKPVQHNAGPASLQPEQVLSSAAGRARSLPTPLENSSSLINSVK